MLYGTEACQLKSKFLKTKCCNSICWQ